MSGLIPTGDTSPQSIPSSDAKHQEDSGIAEKAKGAASTTHQAAVEPLQLSDQSQTEVRITNLTKPIGPPSEGAKQAEEKRSDFFSNIFSWFKSSEKTKSIDDNKEVQDKTKPHRKKYNITEWFKKIRSNEKLAHTTRVTSQ